MGYLIIEIKLRRKRRPGKQNRAQATLTATAMSQALQPQDNPGRPRELNHPPGGRLKSARGMLQM